MRARKVNHQGDINPVSVHPVHWDESTVYENIVSLQTMGVPIVIPKGAQISAEITGVWGKDLGNGFASVDAVRVRFYTWRPAESPQAGWIHRVLTRLRGAV